MALLKGFDPSKQAIVKKGFHEGGRKYVEGDLYNPKSKVGKSKVLFRHFVAKRIEFVEDSKPQVQPKVEEPKVEEPQQTSTTPTKDPVGDDVQDKQEAPKKEYQAPKRRGRKKKTSNEDDLS